MYLLSRIFPGSELDALAGPAGRLRNAGFFAGSHDPERLSSPERFLKPSDFEASENLEPAPLGADLLESEPREVELLESEPLEPDPLKPELLESELRVSELLEGERLKSELRESEPREVRRTAASRLEAEAPRVLSAVLPEDRVADPLEPVPRESEPSDAPPLAEESRAPELRDAALREVVPLAGRRTGESGFE